MHDLRHDPDAIDPVAERTAYLRQWQPVPPGVPCWGRTVMHHDGNTYTNVDPPEPPAPDLRTVGDRVAECEQAIAALQDDSGHTAHKLREVTARVAEHEVLARVAEHEDRIRYLEMMVHRLLNPGEQEGGE